MNTVVPGLGPWEDLLANPRVWHFALHQIPGLPETLVSGRELIGAAGVSGYGSIRHGPGRMDVVGAAAGQVRGRLCVFSV